MLLNNDNNKFKSNKLQIFNGSLYKKSKSPNIPCVSTS